jgi:hypothetical protein
MAPVPGHGANAANPATPHANAAIPSTMGVRRRGGGRWLSTSAARTSWRPTNADRSRKRGATGRVKSRNAWRGSAIVRGFRAGARQSTEPGDAAGLSGLDACQRIPRGDAPEWLGLVAVTAPEERYVVVIRETLDDRPDDGEPSALRVRVGNGASTTDLLGHVPPRLPRTSFTRDVGTTLVIRRELVGTKAVGAAGWGPHGRQAQMIARLDGDGRRRLGAHGPAADPQGGRAAAGRAHVG